MGILKFSDHGKKRSLQFFQISDGILISNTAGGGSIGTTGFVIRGKGEEPHDAVQNAEIKLKKLHNFLKATLDYPIEIHVTSRTHAKKIEDFFDYDVKIQDLIDNVTQKSFDNYLNNSTLNSEDLFIEGIDDYNNNNIVSAFSKLAYYVEGTQIGKKFKPIRDSLSHKNVDSAKEKVEQCFPNEFEFVGKSFDRSSNKNKNNLQKYWGELLTASREQFFDSVKAI